MSLLPVPTRSSERNSRDAIGSRFAGTTSFWPRAWIFRLALFFHVERMMIAALSSEVSFKETSGDGWLAIVVPSIGCAVLISETPSPTTVGLNVVALLMMLAA